MISVSFTVVAALAGCGDMTHNFNTDTGATEVGNDLDNDGVQDGWDQDEVLGPLSDYPGELDINVGALVVPWFEGDALTAICRHENGTIVELHWGYLLGDEYAETWIVMDMDDRLPEGSVICGLTQNGAPILDIQGADILAWSKNELCVHMESNGVYSAPNYSECDGMRPPW
jgi:hypothetical protein